MSLKFLSVKRISYSIAKCMAEVQNQSHAQKYIYYYSLQIFLGTTLEFIFIFLTSLLLGIFKETLVCTIVFITIRFFAGGFHQDTYAKCFFTSLILLLSIALVSKSIIIYYSVELSIVLFMISFYFTYKFAPCDTINKPIISESRKKSLKIKSLILVALWFGISIVLMRINSFSYLTPAIGVAAFVESVSLTPWIADKSPMRKNLLCKNA